MSDDVAAIAKAIVDAWGKANDTDDLWMKISDLQERISAAIRSHGEARERVGAEAMRERIINVLRAEHLDTLQAIYALALSAPETEG